MRNMHSSIHINAVLNRARHTGLDPEHAVLADRELRFITELHTELTGSN